MYVVGRLKARWVGRSWTEFLPCHDYVVAVDVVGGVIVMVVGGGGGIAREKKRRLGGPWSTFLFGRLLQARNTISTLLLPFLLCIFCLTLIVCTDHLPLGLT